MPRYKSKERHPPSGTLSAFLRSPQIPDYILLLLLIGSIIAIALREPFHRQFTLSDPRIQFPHADPERVPIGVCILLSAVLPLAVIVLGAVIRPSSSSSSSSSSSAAWWKARMLHLGVLGLFLSLLSATFFTDLIKNLYGRPRPDLLARCKPAPGTPATELVDWTVCTETRHHVLHDGWRSFPSGHSSFAFSGLWYLLLWIRSVVGRRWGLVVGGWPVVIAMWIAGSRTRDYRHDSYDVTVGSLIGIAAAVWARRRMEVVEKEGEEDEDEDVLPRARRHRDLEEGGFERMEMQPLQS